jgi:hypothetical protein
MLDPSNKRLLALLSAPLFALLSKYAKIDLMPEVQELLVVSVITYILGSHGKEAIVARAQAAGVAAAATVTPGAAADAVVDAAAKGTP